MRKLKKKNNIDDIVVNYGGSQNAKIKQLEESNLNYIHITPDMIGYDKDKKRGF